MNFNQKTNSLVRGVWVTALASFVSLLAFDAEAAKITLTKAQWITKSKTLSIAGKLSQANPGVGIELYDINGRFLGSPTVSSKGTFSLTIPNNELPAVPCSIRATSDNTELLKTVINAPASCSKLLTCSILLPVNNAALAVNQAASFKAKVVTKDKKVPVATQEWDFAGGTLQTQAFRKSGPETTATFVRDNSSYRVRFAATDSKGRRCEDSVNVTVGNPPANLPNKVSEQPSAKFSSELAGVKGDLVVLPVSEWTMQNASDARVNPNLYASFAPLNNTLNAYVYKKDLKPALLGTNSVTIQYSAASNPSDPVGAKSINSTSQNWPVGSAYTSADIRKSDFWEPYSSRADSEKGDGYRSLSWMAMAPWSWDWFGAPSDLPDPDEGYFQDKTIDFSRTEPLLPGSEMPGKANPYTANAPKAMENASGGKLGASVRTLPVVDIDDKNRVNPYPLMRVEALENGTVKASTDAVLTTSKDFKCRECHSKGGIAANPNAPHTRDAFWSSAWVKWYIAKNPDNAPKPEDILDKPKFFDATSSSIEDQEYAAAFELYQST